MADPEVNPHDTARARLRRGRLRAQRLATQTLLAADKPARSTYQPKVAAHRGNKSVAPENTLPAFAAAIAAGADFIEMDVVRSRDGVAMVIHDDTLDATTSGRGHVSDFTAQEIQLLDAGGHFSPAFAGTPVPTFAEFAALLGSTRVRLLLEFKGLWSTQEVEQVIQIAAQHGLKDRTVLQSFHPTTVRALYSAAPDWPRGVLTYGNYDGLFDLCREVEATMLNPDVLEVAQYPGLISAIHSAGMRAMVWTANDLDHWELLCNLEVDGIITDRPDFLSGWLAARGLR